MKNAGFVTSTFMTLTLATSISFSPAAEAQVSVPAAPATITMEQFDRSFKPLCCGGAEEKFGDRVELAKRVAIDERNAHVATWNKLGYTRLMSALETLAPEMIAFSAANPDATIEDAQVRIAQLLGVNPMSPTGITSINHMAIIMSIQLTQAAPAPTLP